jgi:hypothetical protein
VCLGDAVVTGEPYRAAAKLVGAQCDHYSAPHIPHEGFLADFLMRNKGFIGG